MLSPAMGYDTRTSTADVFGEWVQAGASTMMHGSGKKAFWALLLGLLVASPMCSTATTIFEPYTLQVKTCNTSKAGTEGQLLLSFCDGSSTCLMGPANAYNSEKELDVVGAWSTLEVPLESEPTTMSMAIVGNDAWCVEEVVWNNHGNMLGTAGRLYLDGDMGFFGCNYGVHTDTGWYYPCTDSWRFFNLPGSDDYRYEVKVKPCGSSTSTTSGSKLTSPSKISARLCSESQCNETVGEVVDFDMSVRAAVGGNSGWATSLIPAGFNPVAMKLTNRGNFPWCAAGITFNGYTLIDENDTPQGIKLGVGDDRSFFNVQFLGASAVASSDPSGGSEEFTQHTASSDRTNQSSETLNEPDTTSLTLSHNPPAGVAFAVADDELEGKAWDLAWEVVTSIVIFTTTVAITFVARRFKRGHHGEHADGFFDDDNGDEADKPDKPDESPLFDTCHHSKPASGTRRQGLMDAETAIDGQASKRNGGDRASRGLGGPVSDELFYQQRHHEPTRRSCKVEGHGRKNGNYNSSNASFGGMPAGGASSVETVVVAYHQPWGLEPA